ncbi:MAG: OsmC family protein [Candidatus Rokuibacteriota bacterium]
MADDKIETIVSRSSGTIGRALSEARGARLTLDSSTHPRPDALTNSEAFLAGVSSCGVTLIEAHAQQTGVPLTRMEVTIAGVRAAADPSQFSRVTMRFTLAGVSQAQAEDLVRTYQGR